MDEIFNNLTHRLIQSTIFSNNTERSSVYADKHVLATGKRQGHEIAVNVVPPSPQPHAMTSQARYTSKPKASDNKKRGELLLIPRIGHVVLININYFDKFTWNYMHNSLIHFHPPRKSPKLLIFWTNLRPRQGNRIRIHLNANAIKSCVLRRQCWNTWIEIWKGLV